MSHFYDKNGKLIEFVPCKTREGMRPTNVTDAKKMGLYPSVTTIIDQLSKSALLEWQINETIEAAYHLATLEDKVIPEKEDFHSSIRRKASDKLARAADKGKKIHKELEEYYLGNTYKNYSQFVYPVIQFMDQHFPGVKWKSECTFINPEFGYAGTIDLHSPTESIILDFKTKATAEISKMVAYEGHHLQTAAYYGLVDPAGMSDIVCGISTRPYKRYNMFISSEVPGIMKLTESKNHEKDIKSFVNLTKLWYTRNGILN